MKAEKLKMEKLRRKQDEEIRRKNKQKQMKIKKEDECTNEAEKLAADKARRSKGVDEKVGNELNKRKEVESRVAKMERMEMELIKRLQNTQALQQQACQQLETALNPR